MKMEQIECSETSAYKIRTPGNYPKENVQCETTFLSNSPSYPKEYDFEKVSSAFPSDKSNLKMKLGMENWWNDDGGKQKYLGAKISPSNCIYKFSSFLTKNTLFYFRRTKQLMPFREINVI